MLEKLTYTCDPKIVPTLLNTMYLPGHGGFWESEAILAYVPRSEEVRKAIIETAAKRGLGANWTISSLFKDYGCTKEEMKPLITRALARTTTKTGPQVQDSPNSSATMISPRV